MIHAYTVSTLSAPGGIAQAFEKASPPPFFGQTVSMVFLPASYAKRLVRGPAEKRENDIAGNEPRGHVAIGRRDAFGLLGQILQPVGYRLEVFFGHARGVEAENARGLAISAERIIGHADLALVLRVEKDVVGGRGFLDHVGIVADADRTPIAGNAGARAVGLDPDILHIEREERQEILEIGNLVWSIGCRIFSSR